MASVLQYWVENRCTFRMQGVLVLALRGPDGVRKEDAAKPLVRTLRALVMNSGRERQPMLIPQTFEGDSFMRTDLIADNALWQVTINNFMDHWDSYNVHFLQHLMHAFAVVGLEHPNEIVAFRCWYFYERCCDKLHLMPEVRSALRYRLRDGVRSEEDE